ncbi:helix-turn-helix transcriptional regulator [Bosea sp. 47.2.35]|uniref:helix-turn-helix transcriptional regulator n=1 Tax=Bosea sp. 47.2.35 TaxID=2969304 RepID=UPI00214F849F|nr:helix-turn-helix transcriptional regulator [Bosea sp. 47.2.35]MCR4524684.1 helix-turn-helix transcriptional regulator [Bosea sp. 47.2.35]
MKLIDMPSREAVQTVIAASLQHDGASLQETARQLRVSARSLQRHLAEMGTSYSELVAQVRLDTACRLLTQSSERISQIAMRLGYAGPSSFSRTFMRLMKIQPATYRRQRGRAAVPRDGQASAGSPH